MHSCSSTLARGVRLGCSEESRAGRCNLLSALSHGVRSALCGTLCVRLRCSEVTPGDATCSLLPRAVSVARSRQAPNDTLPPTLGMSMAAHTFCKVGHRTGLPHLTYLEVQAP